MALSSMTGFARAGGVCGAYVLAWELKSVNAKGLEVRLRVPAGWEAVETPVRARAAEVLARGTLYATLTLRREGVFPSVRVNEPVLGAVLSAIREVAHRVQATPPSLDGILALKGVIDVVEEDEREEDRLAAETAVVRLFGETIAGLRDMREREGGALAKVLHLRLEEIEQLAKRAEQNPGRRPEAVRARLKEQLATLLDASDRFDADRLHQEALILASKADIREEIDRLMAHVGQARALLGKGGPVGRKLDFVAQEFNREANTICAKSNDIDLTNVGLELKSVVEQFREQVQNLE